MKEDFNILIADRNPHVREFLKREMTAEGYKVKLAKNVKEVLQSVFHYENLSLLILDLNLPDSGGTDILEKIQDRIPTLPVVIHSFFSEHSDYDEALSTGTVFFVEKEGNSVERLKHIVFTILNKKENL